jgi:hypothetical protein
MATAAHAAHTFRITMQIRQVGATRWVAPGEAAPRPYVWTNDCVKPMRAGAPHQRGGPCRPPIRITIQIRRVGATRWGAPGEAAPRPHVWTNECVKPMRVGAPPCPVLPPPARPRETHACRGDPVGCPGRGTASPLHVDEWLCETRACRGTPPARRPMPPAHPHHDADQACRGDPVGGPGRGSASPLRMDGLKTPFGRFYSACTSSVGWHASDMR